jgi:hypothetical protein
MFSKSTFKNFTFVVLLTIFSGIAASAQETKLHTRLAVVATESKTTIWVSDFPKNSSVVLFDEEDNLISIVSTNDFGAAYISLPKTITSTVIAKTINGEISASNRAKLKSEEFNLASKFTEVNSASKV